MVGSFGGNQDFEGIAEYDRRLVGYREGECMADCMQHQNKFNTLVGTDVYKKGMVE